jgi:hypothetical protein
MTRKINSPGIMKVNILHTFKFFKEKGGKMRKAAYFGRQNSILPLFSSQNVMSH